jgi:tRNA A-37 threonylcarbamoyl transferase component Bud32
MSTADSRRPAESEPVSCDGAFAALPRGPLAPGREPLDPSAWQPDGSRPAHRDAYIGSDIDGRYRVEALVGTGGMGLVYRARHRAIDKIVAMKIMRADLATDHEATSRFVTEARAASAVGSAHIVNVTDFGVVPDGSTYFVMEYLEGVTLAQVLEKTGPLPLRRLLNIAAQIAEGLDDAHEAGIIHRDLKPENIFLVGRRGGDFVKILDFGIAKIASNKNRVTRTGQIFGTPHYMSPEQARGLPVDHRSDLYSLGAILYEMATGRVPFDGDNPVVVLSQHVQQVPVPPSRLVLGASAATDLDAVILKCLAKKPAHRYASMAELIEDLRAVGAGATPRAVGHEPGTIPSIRGLAALDVSQVTASQQSLQRRTTTTRRVTRWVVALLAGVVASWVAAHALQRPSGVMRPLFVYGATRVAAVLYRASPQIEPEFSLALAGATRPVALLLSPIDAEAFENGKSLGTMPLTLRVPVGQKIAIVVKREGYWSRAVLVDDTQARRIVRLSRIPGAPSAQAPSELEETEPVPAPNGQVADGARGKVPVSEQSGAPVSEQPGKAPAGEKSVAAPAAASSTAPPVPSGSTEVAPPSAKPAEVAPPSAKPAELQEASSPSPHPAPATPEGQRPPATSAEQSTQKSPGSQHAEEDDAAAPRAGAPPASSPVESAPPATGPPTRSAPAESKFAESKLADQAETKPEPDAPTPDRPPTRADSSE